MGRWATDGSMWKKNGIMRMKTRRNKSRRRQTSRMRMWKREGSISELGVGVREPPRTS